MRYRVGLLPAQLTTADFERELSRIQASLDALFDGQREVLVHEPVRPRQGLVVYWGGDTTTWNPGGGEGTYEYDGSSWTKL